MKIKYLALIQFLLFSFTGFCLESEESVTLELFTEKGNPFYVSKGDNHLYIRCYHCKKDTNEKMCLSYKAGNFNSRENYGQFLKPNAIVYLYECKPFKKKLGQSFAQIQKYYDEFEQTNCRCVIL